MREKVHQGHGKVFIIAGRMAGHPPRRASRGGGTLSGGGPGGATCSTWRRPVSWARREARTCLVMARTRNVERSGAGHLPEAGQLG